MIWRSAFAAARSLLLTALFATTRKPRTSIMLAALWLSASGWLPAQTFTTLHLFGSGGPPTAGLVEGTDGNLYGTTYGYSGKQNGMIFKITPSGTFTTLHSGGAFAAGLILGTDGNFYGTTKEGGTNPCLYGGTNFGCGTLFKITPSGTLTTLYNFSSQSGCADGQEPGALVQGSDGNLYGTTSAGGNPACSGSGGCGTIFKITTTGTLTTLHSFDLTDGGNPGAGLIQATDGNLYGMTYSGGASNINCSPGTCGTVFKITPAGMLTTLHIFDYTDGANPSAALIQASDGNFYGTTGGGGNCTNFAGCCGTVFKVTPTGTLTTLHIFDRADGALPTTLVQHTNGTFYGTTVRGGANVYHACGGWCGTIYSLSVGLGPFVETEPASGNVAAVNILGTNLTGATIVSFNDTAATFTVVSSSEITNNAPAGATTGEVKVVIPQRHAFE